MFNVGDNVVCKSVPRDIYVDDDCPHMKIGKSYEIVGVDMKNDELYLIWIKGEIKTTWFWSNYFYNKTEIRKMKLKKMLI